MPPSLWIFTSWFKERTSANLSASFACNGNHSQISMPGTFVEIGRKTLRYFSGASGLRSYVSSCEGPPCRYSRMTEVSRLVPRPSAARAARTSPSDKPPTASDPTQRNSRRVVGPQQNRVTGIGLDRRENDYRSSVIQEGRGGPTWSIRRRKPPILAKCGAVTKPLPRAVRRRTRITRHGTVSRKPRSGPARISGHVFNRQASTERCRSTGDSGQFGPVRVRCDGRRPHARARFRTIRASVPRAGR